MWLPVTVLHSPKCDRMKIGYHVLPEMSQFSKHLQYFNAVIVSAVLLQGKAQCLLFALQLTCLKCFIQPDRQLVNHTANNQSEQFTNIPQTDICSCKFLEVNL